jgi:hypothetical protein
MRLATDCLRCGVNIVLPTWKHGPFYFTTGGFMHKECPTGSWFVFLAQQITRENDLRRS